MTPATADETGSGPAPLVSVVLPAYNRASSILAAIESVLRQTWTDFELIVVDDGSTDGTPEAAARATDPRVRLVRAPRNMGASAARNLGIAEARGTWVAFQDSDDEWLPLKLEKQMGRLLAPGADYVAAYCGMMILGAPEPVSGGVPGGASASASGTRLRARYYPGPEQTQVEGHILPALMRTSLISTQTLVARRDLLQQVGGFDPDLRALIDWDCVLRLAPLGPIAFVDEPLTLQRFSLNSITRDKPGQRAARIRMAEKHAALFDRHPAIHARHHYTIAGGWRRAGDLAAARASLARARALDPANPRYWATSLWVAALSLLPRGLRG